MDGSSLWLYILIFFVVFLYPRRQPLRWRRSDALINCGKMHCPRFITLKRGLHILSAVLIFSSPLLAQPAVFAAGRDVVLSVEDEQVAVDEILYLLGVQSGSGEAAAPLLAKQMTPEEMNAFLEQVARAILFSKGAIIRGLHLDPEVAARIRWNSINALAEAYIGSMASSLSFDEKALRTHYEEHRRNYHQEELVRVRHILTVDEEQARTALLRLLSGEDFSAVATSLSVDFATAEKGGDMGWISRSALPEPLDEAIFSAPQHSILGPVKTKYGYHVFEVLERRRARALSFEEARDTVRAELVEQVMTAEATSLGRRFPVQTDPSVLERALIR